ncbi:MAG: 4-hydroxy-tetrahydrodipicolinate reductase [Homoserinimonas sp.]
MTTTVAVVGATGTMGRLASRLIDASPDFELVASLSSGSPLGDMDAAELVVDFTHPAVSPGVVEHAVGAGLNVLVGTSGWSGERISSLNRTLGGSPQVGVVIIPNFSVGSALVTSFSAMAARFYESIEIIEAHHAGKVDSPSGTAVRTAELIGIAREALGPVAAPHTDQRARGQQVSSVPIHSVRMRGVIARQEVMLGGTGELVTLRHETSSAQSYEAGILLGLAAARDARGVLVGLESLIDLTPGGTAR